MTAVGMRWMGSWLDGYRVTARFRMSRHSADSSALLTAMWIASITFAPTEKMLNASSASSHPGGSMQYVSCMVRSSRSATAYCLLGLNGTLGLEHRGGVIVILLQIAWTPPSAVGTSKLV